MVQSRHPGRYPKLRSLTLSYPAFEPLTEHHAFFTGLLTVAALTATPTLGEIKWVREIKWVKPLCFVHFLIPELPDSVSGR
jgi:hypothetical protein